VWHRPLCIGGIHGGKPVGVMQDGKGKKSSLGQILTVRAGGALTRQKPAIGGLRGLPAGRQAVRLVPGGMNSLVKQ